MPEEAMTDSLITRIQAGDGDNAEVLRALGWEGKPVRGQPHLYVSGKWSISEKTQAPHLRRRRAAACSGRVDDLGCHGV